MVNEHAPLSALAKGLAVLEAVLTNERLSDVSKATGLSNSTVHRVLGDLVTSGWVHQDDSRRYHPGRRMHALAVLMNDDGEISWQARPILDELREVTGLTVHLGLLKQDAIRYVAKLDGLGTYRMVSRVGGMIPLHCTAIGKSVLAAMPDHEVKEIIGRTGLRRVGPATHTTIGALLEDLRSIRARGWALDNAENEPHLRCVGAPVRDEHGRAIGGVSVSALEFELTAPRIREVSEQVVDAAARISANLGYPGRTP